MTSCHAHRSYILLAAYIIINTEDWSVPVPLIFTPKYPVRPL